MDFSKQNELFFMILSSKDILLIKIKKIKLMKIKIIPRKNLIKVVIPMKFLLYYVMNLDIGH
jgi:hypothetical protein